jgi:serine-type anaerobic sulfatase-maturating enzyme
MSEHTTGAEVMLHKDTVSPMIDSAATRRFHVMGKPSGSACNLDCKYCFYLSKETLPNGPGVGQMTDDTLELFIKQYIEAVTGPEVVFSWQGGEPTLRGLDFYRNVVALQRKYAKRGQRIENDLQTNGVLLNEEWAEFLKKNRFLVGLSIDGPRELHDLYRVNKGGAPTFDKVLAAAKVLKSLVCRSTLSLAYTVSMLPARSTFIGSYAENWTPPTFNLSRLCN